MYLKIILDFFVMVKSFNIFSNLAKLKPNLTSSNLTYF